MMQAGFLKNDELPALDSFILLQKQKNRVFRHHGNEKLFFSDLLTWEIKKILHENDASAVGLKKDRELIGFCLVKKAELESRVFGKEIYAITHLMSDGDYCQSLENNLKLLTFLITDSGMKTDMLSCRVDSDDYSAIHALEKLSFFLVDGLNTYSYEMKNFSGNPGKHGYATRLYQEDDLEKLKEIARVSFSLDRFHNDQNIPKTQSDTLYEKFFENATKGIGADKVVVAVDNGTPIGFNTLEVQNRLMAGFGIRYGSFILTSVDSHYRDRGVYSSLILSSLQYLEKTSDIVDVRMHFNNYPVHRVLSRLGFTISKAQLTFHRWNKKVTQ
jgi:hypothetical protein